MGNSFGLKAVTEAFAISAILAVNKMEPQRAQSFLWQYDKQ